MRYVNGLVTFVDILGFRGLIEADRSGDTIFEISRQLREFGTEDVTGEGAAREALYLHFSDSIVRFTPLIAGQYWQSDRAALLHELEALTHLQGELMTTGVLLRGGVAEGKVYADKTGVFGPAFVDAYTIESSLAQHPRIVLHPDLVVRHGTKGEREVAIYADDGLALTRAGSDGLHFVDYLRNFPREVHTDPSPEREEIARSYMLPRKGRIQRELLERKTLDPVRAKYIWLGRYHDEVVRELLPEEAPDLTISS